MVDSLSKILTAADLLEFENVNTIKIAQNRN
jgi:hypothetical protein